MATQKVCLAVRGMHCSACAQRVERALAKTKGVIAAKVDLLAEEAVVEYAAGSTSEDDLKQAVRNAGFRT